MAEELANLLKKGGNLSIKLAWTNPVLGSNTFAAQTISLDLSDCDGVLIEYNWASTTIGTAGHKAYDYLDIGESRFISCTGTVSGNQYGTYRACVPSSTGVYFGTGYQLYPTAVAVSTDNSRCYPMRIYKVKGDITPI